MTENYSCLNVATPGNEHGLVSSKNKAINSVGDGLNMGRNNSNVSKMFNTDIPNVSKTYLWPWDFGW